MEALQEKVSVLERVKEREERGEAHADEGEVACSIEGPSGSTVEYSVGTVQCECV